MQRLVVITGLSGSGKSLAVRCFEDMGYFCVDNLPVALIPPFCELIQRGSEQIPRAALVVDVREGRFLDAFPETLAQLRRREVPVSVVFFECSDEVLKRRFSETRRPHPMAGAQEPLEAGIRRERQALARLREMADRIVDTSAFTAHQLRAFLSKTFGPATARDGLVVHVLSFGFKYGVPAEADLVFDVRFLPNPYFVDELRSADGTHPEVARFLDRSAEKHTFMGHVRALLDFLLPLYTAEGKSYLTVSLGCTGGKHRSVALAEELAGALRAAGRAVTVTHRDLGRE